MDSDILSQALIKLEIPGFFFLLSPDQVLALFSRISESPLSNLRLIQLNLWDWDVSLVPPEVFAGALSRLETVVFFFSRVTRAQLEALFMLMFSLQEEAGGSKLKKLWFYNIDLTSVSPEVLVGHPEVGDGGGLGWSDDSRADHRYP